MKTRLLTLMLALMMLLSAFAGCKKKTETEEPAGSVDVTVDENAPDIPAVNYDRTINILQVSAAWKEEWDPDKETSHDVLSDAMYTRNAYLMEKYGIDFSYDHKDKNEGKETGEVRNYLLSDLPTYDFMSYSPLFLSAWAQEGLLAEISDLPYMDFSQPWWYGTIMEEITVDGNCYFAIGASNLSAMWTANGVIFNKSMFESYYPNDDLYQVIRDKNWTLESMLTYAEGIYYDKDGITGATNNDRYGIVYAGAVWYPLFYGTGIRMTTKDADGNFAVNVDGEAVIDRITEIITLCNNRDITREFNANDQDDEWLAFAAGGGLFLPESMAATHICRNNMTDIYGVLPTPLLQAGQENYYTPIHPNHSSAMAVGKNVATSDWEMLGSIIVDAAYMSQKVQWPVFFETVLKGRTAKDAETLEMLDIVFTNLVLDPLLLYDQENDVDNAIRGLIADNATTNVYTTLHGLKENVETDLKNAMDQLRGIETAPEEDTNTEETTTEGATSGEE